MNDFLAELQHSWGKSAKEKAREKEYNAEYYRKNKDKWQKYREELKPHGQRQIENPMSIDREAAEDRYKVADKVKHLRQKDLMYLNEARQQGHPGYDKQIHNRYISEYQKAEDNEKNAKAELIKARRREADADKARTEKVKAYNNASARKLYNQTKEYGAEIKAERRAKNPVNKFVSNWKLGAQEIKNSAQKGASFVANLFKK